MVSQSTIQTTTNGSGYTAVDTKCCLHNNLEALRILKKSSIEHNQVTHKEYDFFLREHEEYECVALAD